MTPSVKMMSFVDTGRFSAMHRRREGRTVGDTPIAAAYDAPVLIFLLLGYVPWLLVLTLAVVMWLTVVELLEWRPHYLLVVLVALLRLPDELRRLPLPARLPCLPALGRPNRVTAGRRPSRRQARICVTASGAAR